MFPLNMFLPFLDYFEEISRYILSLKISASSLQYKDKYFKHSQYHYHTLNNNLLAIQISSHVTKIPMYPINIVFS